MQPHLTSCASAPHRAVLGIVPVALGRPAPEGLLRDIASSSPEDLVAVATASHVHPLIWCAFSNSPDLRDAVPPDLPVYFREIQAANARRNHAIEAHLHTLGRIADEGRLTPVALKGAVELLAPRYPSPGARLLSDIDVLLANADLARLRQSLLDLGAREEAVSEINQRGHHHLPPLLAPGWPCAVELHRQLGQGAAEHVLPAEAVLRNALPVTAAGVRVPSGADRLAHTVLHAQFGQTDRLALPRISLRDVIDFGLLSRDLSGEELAAARDRFAQAGEVEAFDRMSALAARLLDGDATRQAAWVDRVLTAFGEPHSLRRQSDLGWLQHYARGFLYEPDRRQHYLKTLASWRGLRRLAAFHRERRRWFR
ncbi:nucleotidyltransferase family protein [Tropicimonas isoalkanivorans]|uniref:Uncharacterized nucleotidyltransferase n=1 Tax=Tropicimonas isoalkanivorans TaxID=441112 RepID=A0A1I1EEY9_9RHOB|nr:nucleotidyltransferase family protein [Tropicimonas isoalkanivorans]SFB85597.1 Uncharacterised nucleotidyltransferase [Tropicimonas isoalkanivorans]